MPQEPFVPGVDPGLKEWARMRNLLRESKKLGKNFETVASGIRYGTRRYWNEEISKLTKPIGHSNELQERSCTDHIPVVEMFQAVIDSETENAVLLQAIEVDHLRFLAIALDKFDVDCKVDKQNRTILHLVVRRGDYYKTKYLIEAGAKVNIYDDQLQGPLHHAVNMPIQFHPIRIARLLLESGADVNAKSSTGFSPLHQACLLKNLKMVELLLSWKADVYCLDNKGNLPLHYAGQCTDLVCDLYRTHLHACGKDRHDRMWAHVISRQVVSSVFMLVEPSCIKCRRKHKDCAALKVLNYRYWLFAHEKDMS